MQRGQRDDAYKKYIQAVDITPTMAEAFMKVLRENAIEFIVAPYEADAQLTWLFLNKRASLIITEDSDLLAYGVQKCFFKMDQYGNGILVDLDYLSKVSEGVF